MKKKLCLLMTLVCVSFALMGCGSSKAVTKSPADNGKTSTDMDDKDMDDNTNGATNGTAGKDDGSGSVTEDIGGAVDDVTDGVGDAVEDIGSGVDDAVDDVGKGVDDAVSQNN